MGKLAIAIEKNPLRTSINDGKVVAPSHAPAKEIPNICPI